MDNKENPEKNGEINRLEMFLNNYGNFLGDCSTNHPHDLDVVLKDFSESIPAPNTDNPQILELFNKGRSFSKESSAELAGKLKNLKEDKIQQIILYTEQLNSSLNSDYERQINRAIELGIYNKNST